MNRIFTLFLITTIFMSCSTFKNNGYGNAPETTPKQELDWKNKCGRWYSKSTTPDKKIREELCNAYEDGTFTILFKETDKDGSVNTHIESGEWGISGNIYFTIIKSIIENGTQTEVDALSPYYRDAYLIINLTDKKFKCQHISSKETFSEIKVDTKFELK